VAGRAEPPRPRHRPYQERYLIFEVLAGVARQDLPIKAEKQNSGYAAEEDAERAGAVADVADKSRDTDGTDAVAVEAGA
jgi:hypothetical protein